MTVLRKIKPSSIGNSYKEDYEFLLVWLSPTGGLRQWFFSSTEGQRQDSFKNSIIDTSADFRSVPNEQEISIGLFTNGTSREEFDFITSLFESNRVVVVGKDSAITPVAVSNPKKNTQRIIKDFEVAFSIMLQEPDLLNV